MLYDIVAFLTILVCAVSGSPLIGSHHDWVDVDDNSPEHVLAERIKDLNRFVDTSVDPCHDFYNFSCGNWVNIHSIPDDSMEQSTFMILRERLNANLRELLEDKHEYADKPDSAIAKTKLFYSSCIDEPSIAEAGLDPLLSTLKSIGKWPLLDADWTEEDFDWVNYTAQMLYINVESFFTVAISPDLYDSKTNILHLGQRGLSEQPMIDTYSEVEQGFNRIGRMYFRMIVSALELIGIDHEEAVRTANETIRLNEKIVKTQIPKLELALNFPSLYERMTIKELDEAVPDLEFKRMARIIGVDINDTTEIAIVSMSCIKNLTEIVQSVSPRTVANFIMVKYLEHFMGDADNSLNEIQQQFLRNTTGVEKSSPRWENCLEAVKEYFNEPLSAMYVRKYFDEESRQDMKTLTTELQDRFKDRVRNSEWMDETTKEVTLDKIDKMVLQLGYPDYMLYDEEIDMEYTGVSFVPDKYFENVIRVSKHMADVAIKRINTPVDESKFGMSPISINAGYDLSKNVILLTAAILQPPIYSRFYPKAMNYGSVGAFVAHEIMHAFDSVGQSFYPDGTLQNLWSDATSGQYNKIATCFKSQYSQYPVGDNYINGDHTANENVADNTGLQTSYEAYQRWLSIPSNRENENIEGIEWRGNQLFFISYAQLWCHKTRPEVIPLKLKEDPHSPSNYRVIGTLANFQEFAEEFSCRLGTEMNPINKCKVI